MKLFFICSKFFSSFSMYFYAISIAEGYKTFLPLRQLNYLFGKCACRRFGPHTRPRTYKSFPSFSRRKFFSQEKTHSDFSQAACKRLKQNLYLRDLPLLPQYMKCLIESFQILSLLCCKIWHILLFTVFFSFFFFFFDRH